MRALFSIFNGCKKRRALFSIPIGCNKMRALFSLLTNWSSSLVLNNIETSCSDMAWMVSSQCFTYFFASQEDHSLNATFIHFSSVEVLACGGKNRSCLCLIWYITHCLCGWNSNWTWIDWCMAAVGGLPSCTDSFVTFYFQGFCLPLLWFIH